MKKCSRCGNLVQDNQIACPRCGGRGFTIVNQGQNTNTVGYSPDFGDPFETQKPNKPQVGQQVQRTNGTGGTQQRFSDAQVKAEDCEGWDIKKWFITMLIMALGPIAVWYGYKKMMDENLPLMIRNYFKVATAFSTFSLIVSILVMII